MKLRAKLASKRREIDWASFVKNVDVQNTTGKRIGNHISAKNAANESH
jgi:hypothetical protein